MDVIKIIFLLFGLLVCSCTSEQDVEVPKDIKNLDNLTVHPVHQQADTVYLEREQIFGKIENENVIFGEMGGVAVDKTGRVLIEDNSQHTIHVFRPDGGYQRSIGGEGKGPGEFSNFRPLPLQVKSDELFAYDRSQQKFAIFGLDSLSLSTTVNLDPQNWRNIKELSGSRPGPFYSRNGGTILVGFTKMHAPDDRLIMYYLIDRKGTLISDKILEHENVDLFAGEAEGQKIVMKLPFSRKSLVTVSDNDYIFSAWSDDFLIKKYDRDGNYRRAFYYPYVNRALSREQVMNTYSSDLARKAVQKAEFPETWPALNSMNIDDEDRLWISTIVDDQNVYQWWVLDAAADGHLLARFKWPRDKPIEEIKDGKVYTREAGEETGLEKIVRYDIEME